jgi:glutamate 5-kinase
MFTKVRAARLASRSGAATVIVAGFIENVITAVMAGENLGTYLIPNIAPIAARKQWLAGQLQVKGRLVLDPGAVKVLTLNGKSLLAVGVTAIEGCFERGDLVSCLDSQGLEVARGLVNYSAAECVKIAGKSSSEFEAVIGYADAEEIIHRDNMVVIV